jgi:TldD protein
MTSAPISLIDRAGLDQPRLAKIISKSLEGADDGELFLEYRQAEMLVFDNGRLKQATYDTSQGFGLRAVKDEAVGYAHASDVSEAAIARAADAVRAVKGGYSGHYAGPPPRTNVKLYAEDSPLGAPAFETKARLLETIDAYARAKDPRVTARPIATCARWCGSMWRSWSATATGRKPAAPAMAAARATSVSSSPTAGSMPLTTPCARR